MGNIRVVPATAERWSDLEALFGINGANGNMGIASVFRSLGFVEVGRASETQLIMRYACA